MPEIVAEELARLSDEELRQQYAAERDPERLIALAASLPEAVLDPQMRQYVATLSLSQQASLMDILLAALPDVPAPSRAVILLNIGEAIEGYWCGFHWFCDVIVRHTAAPDIDSLVLPILRRAIFAADLLDSLAGPQQPAPATWLAEIRRRREAEDFVEHSSDLPHALRRLDGLLAQVAGGS